MHITYLKKVTLTESCNNMPRSLLILPYPLLINMLNVEFSVFPTKIGLCPTSCLGRRISGNYTRPAKLQIEFPGITYNDADWNGGGQWLTTSPRLSSRRIHESNIGTGVLGVYWCTRCILVYSVYTGVLGNLSGGENGLSHQLCDHVFELPLPLWGVIKQVVCLVVHFSTKPSYSNLSAMAPRQTPTIPLGSSAFPLSKQN